MSEAAIAPASAWTDEEPAASETSQSRRGWLRQKIGLFAVSLLSLTLAADASPTEPTRPDPRPPKAEAVVLPPSAAPASEPALTIEDYAAYLEGLLAAWLADPVNQWSLEAMAANRDGSYDRLAHCETQDNWQMSGPVHSGGIGFRNDAWLEWREPGMPDNPAEATKAMQIVVGENIRWGLPPVGSFRGTKWECAPKIGLP